MFNKHFSSMLDAYKVPDNEVGQELGMLGYNLTLP